MCGICGIADWRDRPIDPTFVTSMRDVMRTRGPDDAGLHCEPGVALGHRRLSIIDLSPAGHQPMANETGSVWAVFNGEVYNFQELRSELVDAGHQFASRTDTEVLIHGYEQWGAAALARRLRGMFAVALWDRPRRRMTLIRDHLGKKPLFFSFADGRLVFGSDIKCLWLAHDRDLRLNPEALDEYLYYYFIGPSRSIFQNIHKLPPAHLAAVDEAGLHQERYWTPDYGRKQQHSTEEWLQELDARFRQAVQRRLLADVPLGAFLSGGVDSSCVCAVMADLQQRPRTFSVGFDSQPDYDERRYARRVAEHIGSDHRELLLDTDVGDHLSSLVWHYGEPFADSSALPSYLIAQAAREHVTVVLTGDGGDEAFAGYPRYLTADRDRRLAWLPGMIRRGLLPQAARLATAVAPTSLTARRLEVFTQYLGAAPTAIAQNLCWWDGLRRALYSEAWQQQLDGWHPLSAQGELLEQLSGPTQVDRALEYVLRYRLPGDYLTKVDVATMAHSLEARSPFLDVDLVDFAATIPADVLLASRQTKALVKRYAETLIPREVIHRPKCGFEIPIKHWLRERWRAPTEQLLLSGPFLERGYFEPDTVRRIVGAHVAGRADHTHRIWTLLVLEIWHRLFIDRSLKPGDPVFAG